MPNDLYKKANDPKPFKGVADVQMTPSSWGDPLSDFTQRLSDDRARAHQVAVDAGGFRKHGANGNKVKSKSSAIAPHDKDK